MRRWTIRVVCVLLLAPPVLATVFRFVPVPGTPLMLIRSVQGHGIARD